MSRKEYKLSNWVKSNVENELKHYYENKDMYDEEREEIIYEAPAPPDGTSKGNMVGNPTESKVMKMNTRRILMIEKRLNSIKRVINTLSKEDKQLFDIMYKEGFNARLAKTYKGISEDTFYGFKRKVQYLVAIELGYI